MYNLPFVVVVCDEIVEVVEVVTCRHECVQPLGISVVVWHFYHRFFHAEFSLYTIRRRRRMILYDPICNNSNTT